MDEQPISLPVQEEIPNTVSITPTQGVTPLSQETLDKRATRYSYGKPGGMSYEQIVQGLANNEEDYMRRKAAIELDSKKNAAFQDLLERYSKVNNGITPKEIEHLKSTFNSMLSPTDTYSVFEEYYSAEVLNAMEKTGELNPQSVISRAKQEIPVEYKKSKEIVDEALIWSQYVRTQAETWEEKAKNQGWGGWTVDLAKDLATLGIYSQVQKRNAVEDVGFFTGGSTGANLEAQRKELLRKPLLERMAWLRDTLNEIGDSNPSLAAEIARTMAGQSEKDIATTAAWDAVTVATFPGIGSAGKGLLRAVRGSKEALLEETKQAMKDVAFGAAKADGDVPTIVAATGDFAEAAAQKVIKEEIKNLTDLSPTKQAIDSLLTVSKVQAESIKNNPGNFTTGFVNKIAESFDEFRQKFLLKLMDAQRVDRLNTVALTQAAVKSIKDSMVDKFPGIQNSILDVGDVFKDKLTNTYHVQVKIGDNLTGQFTEYETAHNFATHHGFVDFEVKQQGLGYHIVLNKPLNETDDVIRDLIVETKNSKPPSSWLGEWVTWLRTPEDTLSRENLQNRKIATYTPSLFTQLFKEEAKAIHDLAKGLVKTDPITGERLERPFRLFWASSVSDARRKRWDDWVRTLEAGRDLINPVTKEKGYFFENPSELEYFYRRNFKRSPDTAEVEAYFAFKRITEADLFLRRLVMYRNKSRLGTESHRVSAIDEAGQTVYSEWIDGIKMSHFPGGKDDSILIIKDNLKGTAVKLLAGDVDAKAKKIVGGLNTKERKELEEGVKTGKYVVFEIFAPEHRPFKNFGSLGEDYRPRYVLAPSVETRGLRFEDQVPRRGGGHIEYDYDYYIKQANMRFDRATLKWWYEGDTTIMPMQIRAMGKDVADKLNAVRLLIKDNKMDEARILTARTLPIEWKELSAWFRDTVVDGKVVKAALDKNEPFTLVPRDKLINDIDTTLAQRYIDRLGVDRFKDGTRSGSLNKLNEVEFTGKRDADEVWTINSKGSRHNPLYTYDLATKVDPLVTMNRALNRITNTLYMDDYKQASIEQWIKDAEKYIDASRSELRSAPFYWFKVATSHWKPAAKKQYAEEIRSLEANHWKINQFLGHKSELQNQVESAVERFADWTYGKWGAGKLGTVPADMLAKVVDAPSFIRGVMFHTSMGLLSPVQLMVQSQSFVTIAGVAGYKYASSGTAATVMTQWARLNRNPNIIKELDLRLSKLKVPGTSRWKVGDFEESMKLLDSTGFGNVGSEFAMLDHAYTPKMIESGGKRFLDATSIFFTEAERNVRYAAWHTAYREARDAKPLGRFTDKEVRKILDRADLLNANMSAASNSIMQHGVLSIPAQFFTYQFRIAELFWGKRLGETLAERTKVRARLMAWYAGMYGLPVMGGVTGLPFGDYIKQKAIENKYVVGDNWISSVMSEGIPAMMLAYITGKGDLTDFNKRTRTGTWYNIGDRYGIQGFEVIREALYSDKGFYTLLGGAMGQKAVDVGRAVSPFFSWFANAWRDPKEHFELTDKHLVDVFTSAISSASNLRRQLYSLNTGTWLTRQGGTMEYDVSAKDTFFRSLSGLDRQQNSIVHLGANILKEREASQKEALKEMIKEWQSHLNALRDGDPEAARRHKQNVLATIIIKGYPMEKFDQFMALANQGKSSIVDSINWSLYTKNLPPEEIKAMQDAYTRIQKLKQESK